ncbi:hypothetical protein D3C78_1384690 [compost metagenome]
MGQAAHIRVIQHVRKVLQTDHPQAAGRTQLLINTKLPEAVDVHHAVDFAPAVAQFKQRPYTQTSKRENAARFQYSKGFTEHRFEVRAPLHRQAGEDQVARRILQWQSLGIAGHEVCGTAQWPGVVEHALGNVQRHPVAARKSLTQGTTEMPGATAQVQPALRYEVLRQAPEQLAAHITLQLGHAVVACCRAGE